ncbi:MAG: hypothetical protein LAO78_26365 [Acidobacteriia bacterium]|nr:hypothetical protein [Terriglobia bacterium]
MNSTAVKTILGVVLGDVIFAGGSVLMFYLAKVDPHGPAPLNFIVISVVAGIVLAFAGGFAGSALGARSDMICGMLLTVIIAVAAIVSMAGRPGQGALWSQTGALISAPAALIGDWLRMKKQGLVSRG